MVIVIGSAAWVIGSADRKHTHSAVLIRASLLTSVFMTKSYGPGRAFGELNVTRRTRLLRTGPGRCGLVLCDVWKAAREVWVTMCHWKTITCCVCRWQQK